jgi:hypothetical protein
MTQSKGELSIEEDVKIPHADDICGHFTCRYTGSDDPDLPLRLGSLGHCRSRDEARDVEHSSSSCEISSSLDSD